MLLKRGHVKLYKIQYSKFKAQVGVEKKFVEEYLWVVDTTKKGETVYEKNIELIKEIKSSLMYVSS